ncbi:hypothetical protein [Luteimonas sp. R10]|nr:hypothetical protein U3649_06405 [Luteimonas sp. R10]
MNEIPAPGLFSARWRPGVGAQSSPPDSGNGIAVPDCLFPIPDSRP